MTCRGSVVIPAHDEAAVIARVLAPLAPLAQRRELEVLVICNGCVDETAEVARGYRGVRVIEIAEASKPAALNAGDRATTSWPRLYLDADVGVTASSVCAVLDRLREGGLLAARPTHRYDTTDSPWPVRAFYRARSRLPSLNRHLWGAGAYGVTRAGHSRLGTFPDLTADDLWVDQLFRDREKVIVETEPVVVHAPTDLHGVLAVLGRTYRGKAELPADRQGARTVLAELLRSVDGFRSAADAGVYLLLVVAGRLRARLSVRGTWERDESSRGVDERAGQVPGRVDI